MKKDEIKQKRPFAPGIQWQLMLFIGGITLFTLLLVWGIITYALESENGGVYTGFCIESCSGVMDLCAERVAALNMYLQSGQTVVRRLIAFRDRPPYGGGSGMPCGACREFFLQLSEKNRNMEILVDFETRETVRLESLVPNWWGWERYEQAKKA